MHRSETLKAGELLIERFLLDQDYAKGHPGMADDPYTHFPSLAVCLHQALQAAQMRQPAESTPQEVAEEAWRQFVGE